MKDNNEGGTPIGGPVRGSAARSDAPASEPFRSPEAGSAKSSQGETPPVSTDMQQFIGRQLRAVFDDVAKQPVPDRFLELMRQLDSKTAVR